MKSLLVEQLILHEGFRSKPYKCTSGYWTIGIGRNLDAGRFSIAEKEYIFGVQFSHPEIIKILHKEGITMDQALFLLNRDIANAEKDCRRILYNFHKLSENRKNVVIDMCLNLGGKGFSTFKNTIRYINEGDYKKAAENMLKSKWATQVKTRAVRLSRMMEHDLNHKEVGI